MDERPRAKNSEDPRTGPRKKPNLLSRFVSESRLGRMETREMGKALNIRTGVAHDRAAVNVSTRGQAQRSEPVRSPIRPPRVELA